MLLLRILGAVGGAVVFAFVAGALATIIGRDGGRR